MPIPRSLSVLIIAGLLAGVAHGASDQPAAAKTHVLFMGADLSVQRDKKYYRVENVVGSELMIRINRKEIFVPTRLRSTALKVDHDLKLAGTVVELAGLESGPGYTPGNDPRRKFDRESGAAGGAAAVQDLAYGQMINQSLSAGFTAAAAENSPRPETRAAADAAQRNYETALSAFDSMSSNVSSSMQYNTGAIANRRALELDEANYDAVEASFKISSPVELSDPYMVVMFKILERDAKPGSEGMLIYAKALEPVAANAKPRYIRVREGGLPAGFKFVDCQIHIYNRGREVATNVSSKRVDLTREEARQYLLLQHLGTNKDATVPAAAAAGGLRAGMREQLSAAQVGGTYYVKVSSDGALLGAYADEACNLQVGDPTLRTVLADVFYKPALVHGKPVEGVARVRLSDPAL